MARTRAAKEKRSNESIQTNKVEGDMCLLQKGLGVCLRKAAGNSCRRRKSVQGAKIIS